MHCKIKGGIKAILIKRDGKLWFVIVQAGQEPESLPDTGKSVGLDIGLKSFDVDTEVILLRTQDLLRSPPLKH
jgi:putative transposase